MLCRMVIGCGLFAGIQIPPARYAFSGPLGSKLRPQNTQLFPDPAKLHPKSWPAVLLVFPQARCSVPSIISPPIPPPPPKTKVDRTHKQILNLLDLIHAPTTSNDPPPPTAKLHPNLLFHPAPIAAAFLSLNAAAQPTIASPCPSNSVFGLLAGG